MKQQENKITVFRDPTKDEMKSLMDIANTMAQDSKIGAMAMFAAGLFTAIIAAVLILVHVSKWWFISVAAISLFFWLAALMTLTAKKKCKKIVDGITKAKVANGTTKQCELNGSSCKVVGTIGSKNNTADIEFDIDAKFLEPTCWDRSFTCVISNNIYFVFTTLPNTITPLYTHDVTIK